MEETPIDEEFDEEYEERIYLTPWYVWVLRAVGILGLVVGVLVALFPGDLAVAALSIAITVVWGAIVFMFAETANHVAVMRQQFEYLLDLTEVDVRER